VSPAETRPRGETHRCAEDISLCRGATRERWRPVALDEQTR